MELTREQISYSGGLDTSTILAWLLEQQYEVVLVANPGFFLFLRQPQARPSLDILTALQAVIWPTSARRRTGLLWKRKVSELPYMA